MSKQNGTKKDNRRQFHSFLIEAQEGGAISNVNPDFEEFNKTVFEKPENWQKFHSFLLEAQDGGAIGNINSDIEYYNKAFDLGKPEPEAVTPAPSGGGLGRAGGGLGRASQLPSQSQSERALDQAPMADIKPPSGVPRPEQVGIEQEQPVISETVEQVDFDPEQAEKASDYELRVQKDAAKIRSLTSQLGDDLAFKVLSNEPITEEEKREVMQKTAGSPFFEYAEQINIDNPADALRSAFEGEGFLNDAIEQVQTEANAQRLSRLGSEGYKKMKEDAVKYHGKNAERVIRNTEALIQDSYLSDSDLVISKANSEINKILRKEEITEQDRSRVAELKKQIRSIDESANTLFDPETGQFISGNEYQKKDATQQADITAFNDDVLRLSEEARNTPMDVLMDERREAYYAMEGAKRLYEKSRVELGANPTRLSGPMSGVRSVQSLFGGEDPDTSEFAARKEDYVEAQKRFLALNRAVALNQDPAEVERGFGDIVSRFGEGLGFDKTFDDRDYVEKLTEVFKENGIELTEGQKERVRMSFGEELAQGAGATTKIGIELAVNAIIANKAKALLNIPKYVRAFQAMMGTRYGRAGRLVSKLLVNAGTNIEQGLLFEVSGGNFATGVGESLGEGAFTKMVDLITKGKGGKLLNRWSRIIGGTGGEIVGEYVGDFTSNLNELGIDNIEEVMDRTFGADMDEASRKLLLTSMLVLPLTGSVEVARAFKPKVDQAAAEYPDNESAQEAKEMIDDVIDGKAKELTKPVKEIEKGEDIIEEDVAETPAAETPTAETPTAETPAAETPAVETAEKAEPANPALADVESTAKALEGFIPDKKKFETEVAEEIGTTNKIEFVKIGNRYIDAYIKDGEALTGMPVSETTNPKLIIERLRAFYSDRELNIDDFSKEQLSEINEAISFLESLLTPKQISEAYHEAKKDGSNPELVKAVEGLLSDGEVSEKAAIEEEVEPKQETDEEVRRDDEGGGDVGATTQEEARAIEEIETVEEVERRESEIAGERRATLPVDEIEVAPEAFQFKAADDAESGTNRAERLDDSMGFVRNLAGGISVWVDKNNEVGRGAGKVYVVDGHHRMELAKRQGVKNVDVFYIDAPDVKSARAYGAMANMSIGRGTAVDAAKVYRDNAEGMKNFKPASKVGRDGAMLAKLSEGLFNMVVQGKLPVNVGVIIGENIESQDLQEQFYDVIKNRKLTNAAIAVMAQDMAASPKKTEVVANLFGETEREVAQYAERAKFVAGVRGIIGRAKNLLKKTAKSKSFLEEFGNKIDAEKSGGASQEAAVAFVVFDRLRNTSPEVKALIDEGMQRIEAGENATKVKNDIARRVMDIAEDVFMGRGAEVEAKPEKAKPEPKAEPKPEPKAEKAEPKKQPKEDVTKEVEEIAKEAGVKATNIRTLYDINRKVWGLNRIKALTTAIIQDRMIGQMAKRAGISKRKMYERIGFVKGGITPQGALFQEGATWKSNAKEGIGKISQKSATPEQWVKMITDKGGRGTSQELEWIGLADFLNDYVKENNVKSVPKEVVEQYINDNQIEIVEVGKGGKAKSGQSIESKIEDVKTKLRNNGVVMSQEMDGEWYPEDTTGDPIDMDSNDLSEEAIGLIDTFYSLVEERNNDLDEDLNTKYSEYTLEGGKNYREVLLTLPDDKFEKLASLGFYPDELGLNWVDKNGNVVDLSKEAEQILGNEYKSSHWDERNILAHLRINERTLPNGERVMFIEEVQSDWAQEGKKKGFRKNVPKGVVKVTGNDLEVRKTGLGEFALYYKGTDVIIDGSYKNETTANTILNDWIKNNRTFDVNLEQEQRGVDESVPQMPYKKTDQWIGMAMRRAMQMAAQEGFDRVAWVTGEQSADRYDLSQQIDEIVVESSGETRNVGISKGNEILYEFDVDSGGNITEDTTLSQTGVGFVGKNLEDVVGKDIAQKILDGESQTIQGEGLKVGGEGMKAFYNSILPKVAKKEAQRFDKKADIEVVDFSKNPLRVVERDGKRILISNENGEVIDSQYGDRFKTDEEYIEAFIDAYQNSKGTTVSDKVVGKQLSIAITPEMRMNLNSAVPLFQGAQGAMVAEDGRFILYALTDPNVSTPLHEMAHVFEHYLTDAEKRSVLRWAGKKEWDTSVSEKFARGFEKYLAEGKSPIPSLQKIFGKFKEWLTNIYNGITGSDIDIELNQPMREIYASMLGEAAVKPKKGEPKKQAKEVKEAEAKKPDVAKENLSKAQDNFKSALDGWLASKKSPGAFFDPRSQAEADVKLLKALLDLIKAAGIKAAADIKAFLAKNGLEVDDSGAEFIASEVSPKEGRRRKLSTIETMKRSPSEALREFIGDRSVYYTQESLVENLKESKAWLEESGRTYEEIMEVASKPEFANGVRMSVQNGISIIMADFFSQQLSKARSQGLETKSIEAELTRVVEGMAIRNKNAGAALNMNKMLMVTDPLYLTEKTKRDVASSRKNEKAEGRFKNTYKRYKKAAANDFKKAGKSKNVQKLLDPSLEKKREIRAKRKQLIGELKELTGSSGVIFDSWQEAKKNAAVSKKILEIAKTYLDEGLIEFEKFHNQISVALRGSVKFKKSDYAEIYEDLTGELSGKASDVAKKRIKEQAKLDGVTLNEIIDAWIAGDKNTIDTLVDTIVSKTDLSKDNAKQLAEALVSEVNRMAKERETRLIDAFFKRRQRSKAKTDAEKEADKKAKSIAAKIDKMVELNGIVDADLLRDYYGEMFGIYQLDEAVFEEALKYAVAANKTTGAIRDEAIKNWMMLISRAYGPPNFGEVYWTLFYPSILSGVTTQMVNVKGNFFIMFFDMLSSSLSPVPMVTSIMDAYKNNGNIKDAFYAFTLTNPVSSFLFRMMFIAKVKESVTEGANAFVSGTLDSKWTESAFTSGDMISVSPLESKSMRDIKVFGRTLDNYLLGKYPLRVVEALKYVGRALSSADAAFRGFNLNSNIVPLAMNYYVQNGDSPLDAVKKAMGDLYRINPNTAAHVKRKVAEMAEIYQRETGKKLTDLQLRAAYYAEMKAQIPTEVLDGGTKLARESTLQGEMRGWMGGFGRLVQMAHRSKLLGYPSRKAVPFVRTLVNLMNITFDYSPYGYLRAFNLGVSSVSSILSGKSSKVSAEKTSKLSSEPVFYSDGRKGFNKSFIRDPEFSLQIGRATVGSMSMYFAAQLYYSLVAEAGSDDDDAPYLTGNFAGLDKDQRRIAQKDRQPYMLRLWKGGPEVNYQDMPISPILAYVASYMEMEQNDPKFLDKGNADRILVAGTIAMQSALDKGFFLSLTKSLSFKDRAYQAKDFAKSPLNSVSKVVADGLSPFVPTRMNFFQQIEQVLDPERTTPEDLSDYLGYMALGRIYQGGKKDLDYFGDPVEVYPASYQISWSWFRNLRDKKNEPAHDFLRKWNLYYALPQAPDFIPFDDKGNILEPTEEMEYIHKYTFGSEMKRKIAEISKSETELQLAIESSGIKVDNLEVNYSSFKSMDYGQQRDIMGKVIKGFRSEANEVAEMIVYGSIINNWKFNFNDARWVKDAKDMLNIAIRQGYLIRKEDVGN